MRSKSRSRATDWTRSLLVWQFLLLYITATVTVVIPICQTGFLDFDQRLHFDKIQSFVVVRSSLFKVKRERRETQAPVPPG